MRKVGDMANTIDNIIFLGAGASKAEGAPLQGEIFDEYFSHEAREPEEIDLKKKLANFFDIFFGIDFSVERTDQPSFPTFEEVLGILELAAQRNEDFKNAFGRGGIESVAEARQSLILMIAIILDKKLEEDRGYHRKMVSSIAAKNVLVNTCFVSLNYDILIDNALAALHPEYDLDYGIDFTNYHKAGDWHRPREDKAVKLLKIHGSLNWLYCPTCISLTLTPRKKGVREFIYEPDKCNCLNCDSMTIPIIIPPTFLKVMSNFYLQQVWYETELALREAKKLVFCGYSFPDADMHIKYMLKRVELYRSEPLEVIIVNNHADKKAIKTEQEKDRFLRFFKNSSRVNYTEMSFQEYSQNAIAL